VFHTHEIPLTEVEAAQFLRVSLSTLRRRRRTNAGPAFFRIGAVIRYRRRDLEEFIAANLIAGQEEKHGA
jgi:hypothetical protein